MLKKHRVEDPDGTSRAFQFEDWPTLHPRWAKEVVERCITSRERGIRLNPRRSRSYLTTRYFRMGFRAGTSLVRPYIQCKPADVRGMMAVQCHRIGAVKFAPDMAEEGAIAPEWERACPFCGLGEPETMFHMFFECRAWRKARREAGLLGTIEQANSLVVKRNNMTSPAEIEILSKIGLSGVSDKTLALAFLLGGKYAEDWGIDGYYPGPPAPEDAASTANASVETPPSSLDGSERSSDDLGSSSSEDSDDSGDVVAFSEDHLHLLRVGRFLLQIRIPRMRCLKRLSLQMDRIRDQEQGPAAGGAAEGQSPNG